MTVNNFLFVMWTYIYVFISPRPFKIHISFHYYENLYCKSYIQWKRRSVWSTAGEMGTCNCCVSAPFIKQENTFSTHNPLPFTYMLVYIFKDDIIVSITLCEQAFFLFHSLSSLYIDDRYFVMPLIASSKISVALKCWCRKALWMSV